MTLQLTSWMRWIPKHICCVFGVKKTESVGYNLQKLRDFKASRFNTILVYYGRTGDGQTDSKRTIVSLL